MGFIEDAQQKCSVFLVIPYDRFKALFSYGWGFIVLENKLK